MGVSAPTPAKNVKEFIALTKANPGNYFYGTSGAGRSSIRAATRRSKISVIDYIL